MRIGKLFVVILLACSPSLVLAQQPSQPGAPPPASAYAPLATPVQPSDPALVQGSPLFPDARTGLDVVADDGISTKTVKARPCGTAARETDGTTTCIGIPAERQGKN